MIGPFTEEQIAYMQTKAEARERFDVKIKLKDRNGKRGEIRVALQEIDPFMPWHEELWGEPYIISLDEFLENYESGFGAGYRVDEFLPAEKFIREQVWGRWKDHFAFEEKDEQLKWF